MVRMMVGTACAVVAALASAPSALAATLTVNTQQDTAFSPSACAGAAGDCSLRQALGLTRSGGTVVLPPGHYTIDHTLATGEGDGDNHDLDIGGGVSCPCTPVVLQGAGARTTIIDGAGTDRVLDVYDGFEATISGVTITGGSDPFNGGGIRTGGNTTIINSTITGNTAVGSGGGIHNEADGAGAATTLINSTVSGNTVPGSGQISPAGGGIFNGRGILTVINSTISGNTVGTPERSTARGGGIASNVSGGTEGVVLRNATIHANSAQAASSSGGNISTTGFNVAGTVRTTNSIITGGVATTAANCDGDAEQSLGFNLVGDAGCGPLGTGDIVAADPGLKALGDAGGPTNTLRPLQGSSPVLEKGDPAGCKDPAGATLTTDQRGVPRPLGRCDIGAVELAPPSAAAGSTGSITQTTATIGGTAANPFILDGTTFVEFGTTTSYTRSSRVAAPALTLPAGAAAFGVSATIDKLTPDTLYHYRVVAINGDGTAQSPDATFRTLAVVPPPPPPSRCASRRSFPIRLPRIPRRYKAHKVLRATVKLGSKTLAVVRGARLKSKVNLKNLPKGTFTIKITMKLSGGLVARQSRTYHTCTLKLEHRPPAPKVTRG